MMTVLVFLLLLLFIVPSPLIWFDFTRRDDPDRLLVQFNIDDKQKPTAGSADQAIALLVPGMFLVRLDHGVVIVEGLSRFREANTVPFLIRRRFVATPDEFHHRNICISIYIVEVALATLLHRRSHAKEQIGRDAEEFGQRLRLHLADGAQAVDGLRRPAA